MAFLTGGAHDLPERQRTLQATIDWSYRLLAEGEQAAFRRFSMFRGGATVEAAEAICGADVGTLQRLVEASLIRQQGGRLELLELLREYAIDRLEQSDEKVATEQRHAEWFRDWVYRFPRPPLASLDLPEQIAVLTGERDNLTAAVTHWYEQRDGENLAGLWVALWTYWLSTGQMGEGTPGSVARRSCDRRAIH